jgi:hypothetical protein
MRLSRCDEHRGSVFRIWGHTRWEISLERKIVEEADLLCRQTAPSLNYQSEEYSIPIFMLVEV